MSKFKFVIEIEAERDGGMFASRDELSERIESAIDEAIQNIDLSGVGPRSDSEYSVTSAEYTAVEDKEMKALWAVHEQVVASETPTAKERREELSTLRRKIANLVAQNTTLQNKLREKNDLEALKKTRVWVQDRSGEGRTYLPDGEYDRIRFQVGDDFSETMDVSLVPDGLEIRSNMMGDYIGVIPQSGNVVLIKRVFDRFMRATPTRRK